VLGSLDAQGDKRDSAITSWSQLVRGLADRKADIATGLAYTNEASRPIADLLSQARPPIKDVVAQTDRVASIAVADPTISTTY
jgi:phospholipid/cholesterol/gamma-HCH transport system substrate-binding protein